MRYKVLVFWELGIGELGIGELGIGELGIGNRQESKMYLTDTRIAINFTSHYEYLTPEDSPQNS